MADGSAEREINVGFPARGNGCRRKKRETRNLQSNNVGHFVIVSDLWKIFLHDTKHRMEGYFRHF